MVYELDQSLRSMVKKIACYYSVDLKAARKKSNAILGRSLNPPLPFSLKLLLVPFKMRCPRFPKDGAIGYINLIDYAELVPSKLNEDGLHRTLIHLKNGQSLGSLNVPSTCRQYIKDARLIKADYLKVQGHQKRDGFEPFTRGKDGKWLRFDKRMIIYLTDNDPDDLADDE